MVIDNYVYLFLYSLMLNIIKVIYASIFGIIMISYAIP
uniref:Uncharacterized protein n=1 Tax=Arundo donax TaxID=35708 RepID=A0A0A8ZH90_ARUDO